MSQRREIELTHPDGSRVFADVQFEDKGMTMKGKITRVELSRVMTADEIASVVVTANRLGIAVIFNPVTTPLVESET